MRKMDKSKKRIKQKGTEEKLRKKGVILQISSPGANHYSCVKSDENSF